MSKQNRSFSEAFIVKHTWTCKQRQPHVLVVPSADVEEEHLMGGTAADHPGGKLDVFGSLLPC